MFGLSFKDSNSIFGLDIGYETLKLVQLKRSKNAISLVGSNEIPLVERILEKDHFKNKAEMANLIKEACRLAKPKMIYAQKIVSALPETFVFSKTIQMPKMKNEEYKNAVPIEAAQYLPIPIENTYIDYQILIVHPDEPLVDILFVATPKKLVDDYVEMTKMAGLELVALETKPLAVGRAIASSTQLNGTVIVEIGTELSRISIWDDNNIRLTTTVNTGKNHLLETMGQNNQSSKIDLNNMETVALITGITDEVINAIKYHQNRDYKPKPPNKIMICGSGANLENIETIFEKETKLKTEKFSPHLSNNATLGSEFITSFGLALRKELE